MRTKLVIAAVATAAAVSAVGASAYTNSIGGTQDKVIGYSSTSITGATLHAQPTFAYSTDLGTITGITVVLNDDTTASTLTVSRDGGTGLGNLVSCGHGTTDGPPVTITTYTCTVSWDVPTTTSIAYALQ